MIRRVHLAIPLIVLAAAIIAYVFLNANNNNHAYGNSTRALDSVFPVGNAIIGNSSYYVYVANSTMLQQRGYMNSSGIGDCKGIGRCAGMLFVFPNESVQCFWMKDTPFALKQAWISDGKVNYTYTGTPLSTNVVCGEGSMVLETLPSFQLSHGENFSFLEIVKNA